MIQNICKGGDQQGINLQNTQTAHSAQYQNKQPNQKMGGRSKYAFLQRRNTKDQKAHEKMSTSLIISEMQYKTTMRYRLTLVRMTIIKKSTNNKCWRSMEKREPSYNVGGTLVQLLLIQLLRTLRRFLNKSYHMIL